MDYGGNNHYEALEIFTLDAIIKRFRKEEKKKQLVRFDHLTAKEILALSEEEIERMIFLEKSLNLLNKSLVQDLQLIQFVQETIEEKRNANN